MSYIYPTQCCGIGQWYGVQGVYTNAEEAMLSFANDLTNGDKKAFYLLNSTKAQPFVDDVVAYILENKLGTIVKTEPIQNPRYGNDQNHLITAYLFSPDWDKIVEVYKDYESKRLSKYLSPYGLKVGDTVRVKFGKFPSSPFYGYGEIMGISRSSSSYIAIKLTDDNPKVKSGGSQNGWWSYAIADLDKLRVKINK